MNSLVFKAPINSVSFGNVSVNILREMFSREMSICLFPIGNVDLSVYDKLSKDFSDWIQSSIQNRYKLIEKEMPTLQLWHINGSENRITKDHYLLTFYELDSPTETEKNIVNIHDKVMFSSRYASKQFQSVGCKNSTSIPMGFDPDFYKTGKKYLEDKIHFGIMGKWEKRKHTAKIIKLWAEKYGNNYNYQLSCCVTNPFIKNEQLNQLIGHALEGKKYGNINFLPFLKTNSEVNEFVNAIDIDLSGLSGAEGWNLPSFNASALGKWSIVLNSTSHKDWANSDNSILVEPVDKVEAYDNTFFHKGSNFNQGNIYSFDDESVIFAMESAEKKCKKENKEGLKLQKTFSYGKTLDEILKYIKS